MTYCHSLRRLPPAVPYYCSKDHRPCCGILPTALTIPYCCPVLFPFCCAVLSFSPCHALLLLSGLFPFCCAIFPLRGCLILAVPHCHPRVCFLLCTVSPLHGLLTLDVPFTTLSIFSLCHVTATLSIVYPCCAHCYSMDSPSVPCPNATLPVPPSSAINAHMLGSVWLVFACSRSALLIGHMILSQSPKRSFTRYTNHIKMKRDIYVSWQ